MDRLNFSPQASPTGQYHRPEVRASDAGSDLAQIAQALGQLSPKLASVSNQLFAADLANREAEVKKYLAEKQITNQKQFKALVDAGQIPWAANPWSRYFADTLIAGMEVEKIGRDLFAEYSKQGMQNEKDVVKVESFIDDHFSQQLRVADRNPDEMRVIYDRMRQIKDNLLERHVSYRAKADIEDMALGAEVELGSLLASGGSSEAIDKWRLNAERFLPKNVVNDMLVGGVASYAEATNNPSLFEQVLSQIKTPGGDLLMIPRNREKSAELYIRAAARDAQAYNFEKTFRKDRLEAAVNARVSEGVAKFNAIRQKNPQATFDDVGFSTAEVMAMSDLPVEAREAVLADLAKFEDALDKDRRGRAKDIASDVVRNAIPKLNQFRLSHPGEYPFDLIVDVMQSIGAQGGGLEELNAAQNFITPIVSHYGDRPPTDEKLYKDLEYLAHTGKLSPLIVHANRQRLTSGQVASLYDQIDQTNRNKPDPVRGVEGLVRGATEQLETRLRRGLARTLNDNQPYDVLVGADDSASKALKLRIDEMSRSVAVQFNRAVAADLSRDSAMTYEKASALVDRMVDQFSDKHGGLSKQQYQDFLDPRKQLEAVKQSSSEEETATERPATEGRIGDAADRPELGLEEDVANELGRLAFAKTAWGMSNTVKPLTDQDFRARTGQEFLTGRGIMLQMWHGTEISNSMVGTEFHTSDTNGAQTLRSRILSAWANLDGPKWAKKTIARAKSEVKQYGGVLPETKDELAILHNYIYTYEVLTKSYGYQVSEVQKEEWKTKPLFSSYRELIDPANKNQITMMAKLYGVNANEFRRAQAPLVKAVELFRRKIMN